MENLLPPLAILLVVAAAVVLMIRAGVRRSRASLGDALSGGPDAAAAASSRLTEAQHRSIYSLIARGQTVQAIAAYREATRTRLVDARDAVLLMDRYPQPYRGGATGSPVTPTPDASGKPAPSRPSTAEPSRTEPSLEESPRTEAGKTEPATAETAGPEARAHRDAAEAPKAPESADADPAAESDTTRAGDPPSAPRASELPPAVVRPSEQPPARATADAGEGRPQRFPYRYRAIVSNGRQTLEVASNMLNEQIYSEIKELAHIGDTEDAAQMLCRHSDISIEDARAFVALL